jgi:hypothetical protein
MENTPIRNLGKYGLIEQLSKGLEQANKKTVKGIGNDASGIDDRCD